MTEDTLFDLDDEQLTAKAGCPAAPCSLFSVLDLFSGIGGFALATEWAGGSTIGFSEVAEYQSKILKARFPGVPNLGDVTKICRRIYDCEIRESEYGEDESVWCPRCEAEFGECECIGSDEFTDTYGFPDVIAGGVPCQPASLVGKRDGTEDERWLWPDTIRIMRELRPRFGIFENPAAILSLESGRAFGGILGGLAEIGYDVQWHCLPASAVGAGHRRERLWILATDSDCKGLEGFAWDGKKTGGPGPHGHHAPPNLRDREVTERGWYRQSGIRPVVNGIPSRVARDQLTAIGNSLVPQVAYIWMNAIGEFMQSQAKTINLPPENPEIIMRALSGR